MKKKSEGMSSAEVARKMAEIDAKLKLVRRQKKAMAEEDKERNQVKITTKSKTEPFKSGRKAEMFHPNLDYAMAEVSFSPYLLAHLPKYEPDTKSATLMNQMRFMGPTKCEKLVSSGKVTLPLDLEKAKSFVIDEVMTYNPDFGPGVKKPGAQSRQGSSRPQTADGSSMVKGGSTFLTADSLERPRSPQYEAAIARGGPETYMAAYRAGSLSTLGSTDSTFQSHFAPGSPNGGNNKLPPLDGKRAVPQRAKGYYTDRYKYTDKEWEAEVERRHNDEKAREDKEREDAYAAQERAREREEALVAQRAREAKERKEAAKRAVAAKEARRQTLRDDIQRHKLQKVQMAKALEAARSQEETGTGAMGGSPSERDQPKKKRSVKGGGVAAKKTSSSKAESRAEGKDAEEAKRGAKNQPPEVKAAASVDIAPPPVEAPAPTSVSAHASVAGEVWPAGVVVQHVRLRGVRGCEWYGVPEDPFLLLQREAGAGGWKAKLVRPTVSGDDAVWNAAGVELPCVGDEVVSLQVELLDDTLAEGEVSLARGSAHVSPGTDVVQVSLEPPSGGSPVVVEVTLAYAAGGATALANDAESYADDFVGEESAAEKGGGHDDIPEDVPED